MNPLLQRANGSSNQATAPSNHLNLATPLVRRTFNRFDNSYKHYTSVYYAENTPFFVQEMNAADYKRFKSIIQVRTESLKSPLYSGVKMNKDYFFTPYDALLPINWEKIFKNPSQGDDVPEDANTIIPNFPDVLSRMIENFIHDLHVGLADISSEDESKKSDAAYGLVCCYLGFPLIDAFLSSSGICSRMGSPFSHLFRFYIDGKYVSWDRFTEYLFPVLFCDGNTFGFRFNTSSSDIDYLFEIDSSIDGSSSFVSLLNQSPSRAKVSPKDVLSLFRYYPTCMRGFNDWFEYFKQLTFPDQNAVDLLLDSLVQPVSDFDSLTPQDKVFNYSRMAAYALSCAQFYSNGNVDSVYNAQLYRDMMSSFARSIVNNAVDFTPTFFYNGVSTSYDWLSGHYCIKAFENIFTASGSVHYSDIFYLRSIFDISNTLKYGDYFTGSHTRPLAVGDVTAPVVGDKVSAIDLSKAISYQKFLNVVVKLKNEMKEYLSSIFGTLPAPDYHESKLVSHSEGSVDGFEVANTTSEDQGNLTSLLHNVQEQFEYELEIDQPGVALGVVSFVASRAYSMTSDRQIHIANRYDMFNPMLQNIGDQPVLSIEKSGYFAVPFAYQSRFMEYKQRVNVASGAFVDKLRSYCIISDNLFEPSNALEVLARNLTPAYIRLTPREFDRFFVRNGSWSYGNNYHFICEFDNQSDDVREADYSPSIL